jgi:membrane protease YdiL (CAAX protease family)
VLLALPLLLLYEVLAAGLRQTAGVQVRNGADVLLKSLFVALGGLDGLAVFGVLLFGTGAVLVWRDLRRHGWRLRVRYFAGMVAESVLYALLLGFVAGMLTAVVLGGVPLLAAGAAPAPDVATQLMISLGAGLYEELLFRVILVTGLALLARRIFGWGQGPAAVFAIVTGALIFSAFHYVGPYGDTLEAGSFTFRLIAGLLFSGLYVIRGFGITAWTHALYDVFLTV